MREASWLGDVFIERVFRDGEKDIGQKLLLEVKAIFCHDKAPHKIDLLGLTYRGLFKIVFFSFEEDDRIMQTGFVRKCNTAGNVCDGQARMGML